MLSRSKNEEHKCKIGQESRLPGFEHGSAGILVGILFPYPSPEVTNNTNLDFWLRVFRFLVFFIQ